MGGPGKSVPSSSDVAIAVDKVGAILQELTKEVSQVSGKTTKILECLVSSPTMPELSRDAIEPVAARQDVQNNLLVLTVKVGTIAKPRDVEVVFEGAAEDELPARQRVTSSGKYDLPFALPRLWISDQDRKARFVTVNVIDTANQTTHRHVVSVPSPTNNDDDE